eukprot:365123-Chlamydomonas_euryale.AAC.11
MHSGLSACIRAHYIQHCNSRMGVHALVGFWLRKWRASQMSTAYRPYNVTPGQQPSGGAAAAAAAGPVAERCQLPTAWQQSQAALKYPNRWQQPGNRAPSAFLPKEV